jgi:hypothetical protein
MYLIHMKPQEAVQGLSQLTGRLSSARPGISGSLYSYQQLLHMECFWQEEYDQV